MVTRKIITKDKPRRKPAAKKRSPTRKRSPSHQSQNRIFEQTDVYSMFNIPFFFLQKFGISDKTKQRRKSVSETTPGFVGVLLSVNLAYGYECEQFVHGLYYPLNFKRILNSIGVGDLWHGSGHSEWFVALSPIVGTIMLFLNYRFGLVGLVNESFGVGWGNRILWFAYFTPFVWFDALFWLILFRGLKLTVIVLATIVLIYFVANLK